MDHRITNQQAKSTITHFQKDIVVNGLRVPIKKTNLYHKELKRIHQVYQPNNMSKVLDDGDHKIILVADQFQLNQLQIEVEGCSLVKRDITLTHSNLSAQNLFQIFTDKVAYPHSFQTAGHIAHFNLTPEQDQYRYVIGQITLLKCPNIKTVVNKTQKLHNVYRTPTLQHMAGENNYEVKMKEVGVWFTFNFQKVYWCSRLQKQRDRMLSRMKPNELLADIFCGVGPLSVRAAKKKVNIIANDLNPFCYEYLVKNCQINEIENRVICWNMCAREAMIKIYKEKQEREPSHQEPDHIYMNLPVDAIEFLDVFVNYGASLQTQKMPLIHVNCFVVADSDEKSMDLLQERIGKVLPGFKKEDIVEMHHIKNVTVIMRMYCVSFRLRPKYQKEELEDVIEKKIKTK